MPGDMTSVPGRVHDHRDAQEADGCAGQVVAVGPELVDDDAPGQRAGDEDAAVSGEDPAEAGVGLEGGDKAVRAEGGDAGTDPEQAPMFADALPDEPSATDFGD